MLSSSSAAAAANAASWRLSRLSRCVLDHRAYIVPGETPVVASSPRIERRRGLSFRIFADSFSAIALFAELIEDELAEISVYPTGLLLRSTPQALVPLAAGPFCSLLR